MFVLLQDGAFLLKACISKDILPFTYKGISIVDKNNKLIICLKKGYFFSDRDKMRYLEEGKYVIKASESENDLILYVYKDSKGIDDYKIYNNEPFVYLNSPKASIINEDPLLNGYYLIYKDHKLKTNASVLYLNGRLYKDEILKNGDFISFYNFQFYYYDQFLYINNFLVQNKIKEKIIEEHLFHYENAKPITHNYLLDQPKQINISELKKYNEIKKIKQRPLVYQIGPSLTMSLALIFVALINIYKNYLNEADLLSSIVYLITPLIMIISGILWPLLTRLNEKKMNNLEIKKEKDKYLDYLLNYRKKMEFNILDVIKERNDYYFDGSFFEDKLFYITNKSPLFLNISLGFIEYSKNIEINKTDDEDINEALGSINYYLKHIDKYPYFLDLKKYHLVSIVAKEDKLNYILKKYLLELSIKYHYDDYYVAIYSKELNDFNEFFNIPSIIYHNSRLT